MTEQQAISATKQIDATTAQAIEEYKAGKIDITELRARTIDSGISWWDTRTESRYKHGDNTSREKGQTYNPFNHPKGKFWQAFLKPTIRKLSEQVAKNPWIIKTPIVSKVINFIHTQMKEQYYEDVFTYDDEFLLFFEQFAKSYIDMEFMNGFPKKHYFMNQAVDIILGLNKEDVYYRARFKDFMNKFVRIYIARYPISGKENEPAGGIPLTPIEQENINKWH